MSRFAPLELHLPDRKIFTLRHCLPSEAKLFEPFRQCISQETRFTLQSFTAPELQTVTAHDWAETEQSAHDLRLGIFYNGYLVALLGYNTLADCNSSVQHVSTFGMAVRQKFWGLGLGRKLLETMESHARSHGHTRIEATVRTQNVRAIIFYLKSKYQIEGTRKNAALIEDLYEDEYFIAKILTGTSPVQPVF